MLLEKSLSPGSKHSTSHRSPQSTKDTKRAIGAPSPRMAPKAPPWAFVAASDEKCPDAITKPKVGYRRMAPLAPPWAFVAASEKKNARAPWNCA